MGKWWEKGVKAMMGITFRNEQIIVMEVRRSRLLRVHNSMSGWVFELSMRRIIVDLGINCKHYLYLPCIMHHHDFIPVRLLYPLLPGSPSSNHE